MVAIVLFSLKMYMFTGIMIIGLYQWTPKEVWTSTLTGEIQHVDYTDFKQQVNGAISYTEFLLGSRNYTFVL